jgi:hypothetical protein
MKELACKHIKGLLGFVKNIFAEDSNLFLCSVCSLGTGIGLALSATCSIISEDASVGILCFGLFLSIICSGIFLYVAWKMD